MIPVNLDQDRQFIFDLPYNLTLNKVRLEPGTEHADPITELEWLAYNADADELGRIMTSALILRKVIVPSPSWGSCLATAIIWERG